MIVGPSLLLVVLVLFSIGVATCGPLTAPFLVVVLLASAAGCSLPEGLKVTVLEASPGLLDPARDDADDLAIRVAYKDGNGDLGGGIGEIHDCRADGVVTRLVLPPIASEEAVADGVAIEGKLLLHVADVGVLEPDLASPAACVELGVVDAPLTDRARFCVVLEDLGGERAGDCTDEIMIALP
ncbi:MAG: hypothetical protein EXR73_06500 [Myxococcales bacterium]|nr:hypothetical protein [Myxococcales bacterium]